jgi:isoamylase
VKQAWPGRHHPLGATWDGSGTNFAIYAEHADRVVLVLVDSDGTTTDEYELAERTDLTWHGYVEVAPGQHYGYRVWGPYDAARGKRYNANKLLLDPYAKALSGDVKWGPEVFGYEWGKDDTTMSHTDSARFMPLSVVVDPSFGWVGDRRPNTSWANTVIYEMHTRGFTKLMPGVPEHLRGTYAGLAHPASIGHLKSLGITAVELMPIHEFVDAAHLIEQGLVNYWGYDPAGYFAPEARYCSTGDATGRQVREFKEMVRSLHVAGLEIILDVVYNHTAEGNELGPTLSFRGIDNDAYYRLDSDNPRFYVDVTGCGNSLNAGQPQTLQLVMDSLRYWVTEMHVDGFRFDLASALARQFYEVNKLSAFFDIMHQDPVLSQVKLVAEPWDVGEGGYQVGNFPVKWAEWNGKFRDTVRDYWRGERIGVSDIAYRLTGSSDLYQWDGRAPSSSINFVTAHDGFTLRDLVSYNQKHNEANGEASRDGSDDNRSWNCGVEGDTIDPAITALRARQQRNLLATMFVSQGCPMILAGDEIGRTQLGNNNAYCQDNAISWMHWDEADQPLLTFTKRLISLRRDQIVLRRQRFFTGQVGIGQTRKDVAWFRSDGVEMAQNDWGDRERHSLGMLLDGEQIPDRGPHGERTTGDTLLVLLHSAPLSVDWTIPPGWGDPWEVILDTNAPDEAPGTRRVRIRKRLNVASRSLVVLRRVDAMRP